MPHAATKAPLAGGAGSEVESSGPLVPTSGQAVAGGDLKKLGPVEIRQGQAFVDGP